MLLLSFIKLVAILSEPYLFCVFISDILAGGYLCLALLAMNLFGLSFFI